MIRNILEFLKVERGTTPKFICKKLGINESYLSDLKYGIYKWSEEIIEK